MIFTILGGAIFVRWGKHGCPDNDTELVYSGKKKQYFKDTTAHLPWNDNSSTTFIHIAAMLKV